MNYPKKESLKIKALVDACDDLVTGQIILSDINISKILKVISTSEYLYNLFGEVLKDFNFREECENCVSETMVEGGYFVLPKDDRKIMALVFRLLLEIENKKMNVQAFVDEYYFSPHGYAHSFANFVMNIIMPFKDAICNVTNFDEDEIENVQKIEEQYEGADEQQVNQQEPQSAFDSMCESLNELNKAINNAKLKQDVLQESNIVISAVVDCVEQNNIKILNALMISMEYLFAKNKKLKQYYANFKSDFIKVYYS